MYIYSDHFTHLTCADSDVIIDVLYVYFHPKLIIDS